MNVLLSLPASHLLTIKSRDPGWGGEGGSADSGGGIRRQEVMKR